jgi:hypothetical protein
MYSDSERGVEVKPKYSALFRDIKGVKKNVVSMPFHNKIVEIDTLGKDDDHYDRGPDKHQFAFEIQMSDRLLTLYSDDA